MLTGPNKSIPNYKVNKISKNNDYENVTNIIIPITDTQWQ
jgi:hypothetical protein